MKKLFLVATMCIAFISNANAGQQRTPEQACQAQALGSIAHSWPNIMQGQFQIVVKDHRCLVFLQAPAIFEGKRAAWLIDGKAGDMIAGFYAPVNPAGAWQDSDPGNCT
jgi:hypothetical protein